MYLAHNTDKQVFKDLDFLGWYTTGNNPTEQDIMVHKQVCEINECPIMLQMNPQSRNFDVRTRYSFVSANTPFWSISLIVDIFEISLFFATAITGENLRVHY